MYRIPLVGDNHVHCDTLQRCFGQKGFELRPAPDGRQGVDLARREGPDLALMEQAPAGNRRLGNRPRSEERRRHRRYSSGGVDGARHGGRPEKGVGGGMRRLCAKSAHLELLPEIIARLAGK
jgi:hypothetical protein